MNRKRAARSLPLGVRGREALRTRPIPVRLLPALATWQLGVVPPPRLPQICERRRTPLQCKAVHDLLPSCNSHLGKVRFEKAPPSLSS